MTNDFDKQWVAQKYPGLEITNEGISGVVEFTATYNKEINSFLILDREIDDTIGGVKLSCRYSILIQDKGKRTFSSLPAVYVNDVEPIMDRHFNHTDKSGCLCSPLEENKFLNPEFQFIPFFEQLIIPFLYGQEFYTLKKHWPWVDYAHGSTGLLESYFRLAKPNMAQECFEKLSNSADWPRIKSILSQKSEIKGHTYCFCPSRDQIRRCHHDAWQGIRLLRKDIKDQGIPI